MLCKKTWNHQENITPCDANIRATLRSSSNIYYAVLESSIFVPENYDSLPEQLIEIFNSIEIRTTIRLLNQAGQKITPEIIRNSEYKDVLKKYSDDQIEKAIKNKIDFTNLNENESVSSKEESQNDFKYPEYELFQKNNESDDSRTIVIDKSEYKEIISKYFDKITLVKTLKKTEVLCGFNRVVPNSSLSKRELSELMWRRNQIIQIVGYQRSSIRAREFSLNLMKI